MRPTLSLVLEHLAASAASLVVLRAGQPPRFWPGTDHGPFEVQTADDVKKAIRIPLTDAQLADFRRRHYASVPLAIAKLGTFHLEAYVREGHEEVIFSSPSRCDAFTMFRGHQELIDEARATPDDVDVYWNLGVAFLNEREPQLAWHAFSEAHRRLPQDVGILCELGKVLGSDLARVDEAIDHLTTASALPDTTAEVFFELAAMLRSSNRTADAQDVVARGLALFPGDEGLLEARDVLKEELSA